MLKNSLLLLSLGLLAACASGPEYRADFDKTVDFSAFRTWNFVPELGTQRAGYSTLVTTHFRNAVAREMQARGYVLNETNPDLLVNFSTSARERTEVQSTPSMSMGVGYYGYRGGMYSTYPMYGSNDVTTVHYKVGTANVDVVDAKRKQLIWEGVIEGKITDKMMSNVGGTIDTIVTEIFTKYPASAGTAAVIPAK